MGSMKFLLLLIVVSCFTTSCITLPYISRDGQITKVVKVEYGEASWYSEATNSPTAHATASGIPFRDEGRTAAHKTLPMGTRVRVTNLANNLSEVVTITDRGPYTRGRIVDVSIGCAERLGFRHRGVTDCKLEVLAD